MVGNKLEVVVKAPPAQQPEAPSAPPTATAAPAGAEKPSEILDDRIGVSFADGKFNVTVRLEERMTPEHLIDTFEKQIVPRARQLEAQFNAICEARERSAKEVQAWLPNYQRAKKMLRIAELEREVPEPKAVG